MRIGLGSGSTARHFVQLLGARVRDGLSVIAVPTSEATRAHAAQLGIPLSTLNETPELDLTVDGADEIAPNLTVIKGGGGALLWEKIGPHPAPLRVVGAHHTKGGVPRGLPPLPIGGVPSALAAPRRAVEAAAAAAGCPGPAVLRHTREGHPFVTDGGHHLLDASLGRITAPEALAAGLARIPGVVEHGLFVGLVAAAVIAGAGGVRIIQ